MKMDKIVVAVDGSPRQKEVLRVAAELAQQSQAELLLVRAVTVPVELPPQALAAAPGSVATILEDAAHKDMTQLEKDLGGHVKTHRWVGLGAPWRVICDVASEQHADLIVVGSHGYGTLERLIGTTADKVLHHADRNVLVVRTSDPGR
jgi:nucleotide-binding universal stress UspA family protein